MWKAAAGYSVKPGAPQNNDDDDWETEADFVVCTSNILLQRRVCLYQTDMHGPNHSNKYCHYVKQGTTIFYKYELLMFLCVCQLQPITEWKHFYTFITYTFDN